MFISENVKKKTVYLHLTIGVWACMRVRVGQQVRRNTQTHKDIHKSCWKHRHNTDSHMPYTHRNIFKAIQATEHTSCKPNSMRLHPSLPLVTSFVIIQCCIQNILVRRPHFLCKVSFTPVWWCSSFPQLSVSKQLSSQFNSSFHSFTFSLETRCTLEWTYGSKMFRFNITGCV